MSLELELERGHIDEARRELATRLRLAQQLRYLKIAAPSITPSRASDNAGALPVVGCLTGTSSLRGAADPQLR
jgi:hypothetical protein